MIKQKAIQILKSNFRYLSFFYKYLRSKVLYIVLLSFFVSMLDALSLSMFIPLFEVASGGAETAASKSDFQDFLSNLGINMTINNILLLMFVFFIIKGLFRYLDIYTRARLSAFFIKGMRLRLLHMISNLKYSKFIATDQGTIQNTVSVETAGVISAYTLYISVFQNFIFVLVYITMSLWANSKFTLIVIFGGFISKYLLGRFYTDSKKISYSITQKNNAFLSLVMQQLTNFKYLKSTAAMPLYVSKIRENINETENEQMKLGYINARVLAVREPIVIVFVILAIYIQVNLLKGELSAILLSLLFFYRAFNSLLTVQSSWMGFLKYVGSIIHIEKFEKELSTELESNAGTPFTGIGKEIRLENISFEFNPEAKIIRGLSYTIPKNSTIAIVGKSGSGKTTLVNIISSLLVPNKGVVLVDGVDINTYNKNSYRSKIGLISQETVVFNDSLYNNVTFWADKSKENLDLFFDVIEKVDLAEFMENSLSKEDTLLGDSGVIMSGGQRQRLSIARELFKKTELLILDEATSSLDSHTEKLIQESIERIKGRVTIIIIAHRLSTIKNADQILLLKNGEIESSGNFNELISHSATFASMVAMQEI